MTNASRTESMLKAAAAVLAIAVAVGAADTAFAQGGRSRVRGTVTDSAGEPLAGVRVTAYNPNFSPSTYTAETDEDGDWAMIGFGNRTDNWTFTFELDGYETLETGLRVSPQGRNDDLEVSLERRSQTGAAGAAMEQVNDMDAYREGVVAFEAGDFAGARDRWTAFVAANPDFVMGWLRLAEAHYRLEDSGAARAAYERVLTMEAEQQTALFMLGAIHASDGEFDSAVGYFERVIAQDPENPSLYYNIGEIYFERGEPGRAIEFYGRATEVDPEYAVAYKQLGFAYLNSGDAEGATAAFERFLELEPTDSPEAAVVVDILAAIRAQQ